MPRFNPRTHTGCDKPLLREECQHRKFQSTHPYRVRLVYSNAIDYVVQFQSTHPYRVRRPLADSTGGCRYVSIHAPIQGATGTASARSRRSMFQSTHPYRVRRYNEGTGWTTWEVSIHAPIQGATSFLVYHIRCCIVSIHAPIQGATVGRCIVHILWKFQSTHPYRVRHNIMINIIVSDLFQSTHPYRVRRVYVV